MILQVVSISGGKDSLACALLALEQFPLDQIRFVFADTGNEHEQTYAYVREYLPTVLGREIHEVRGEFADDIARKRTVCEGKWRREGVSEDKIARALAVLQPTGNPFLDLCIWKGRFPSRMAQFCTAELKRQPLNDYHAQLVDDGHEVVSWQGVRRDESLNRRDLPEREAGMDYASIYRPILDWTAAQVVAYSVSKGVTLNPLYSQGMGRVGCFPCINARKSELNEISRRFPQHIDRIREWEAIVTEASKRGGATFFAGANFAPKGSTVEEYAFAGSIDQVVEWSKTTWGGVQYDLMGMLPTPACSSQYGLCE